MNSKDKRTSTDKARNLDDLINDILLTLNENRETVAVLVEGADDIEFFEKVFDDFKNIVYFESLSGYVGLYDVLKELSSPRVIAVRDRDYTNPDEYPSRMFAYDDCAMELMILHHPYAQKRLGRYYSRKEENFPLDLMKGIAAFSLLRQRNALNGLGIAFDDMGGVLAGHKNREPLPPDMEKLFGEYARTYPQEMAGLYETLQADAQSLANETPEKLWDITNGHDICKLLGILSTLDKGALGEKGYFHLMIEVYQFQHFQGTYLYRKLSEYRLKNGKQPFSVSE